MAESQRTRKHPAIQAGNVFAFLTVKGLHGRDANSNKQWECVCVCGNIRIVRDGALKSGAAKSCGCKSYKPNIKLGMTFGYWTVIGESFQKNQSKRYWPCRCTCGRNGNVEQYRLLAGTHGCICKTVESNITHNKTNSPEYRTWASMKQRCLNPNNPNFIRYGGRGIKICERWLESFDNFYSDMGKRPSDKHSIDRIDNSGNYEPSNCRWATTVQQSLNTRITAMITYNGVTMSRHEWASKYGITHNSLRKRMRKGWDIKEALETPLHQCSKG